MKSLYYEGGFNIWGVANAVDTLICVKEDWHLDICCPNNYLCFRNSSVRQLEWRNMRICYLKGDSFETWGAHARMCWIWSSMKRYFGSWHDLAPRLNGKYENTFTISLSGGDRWSRCVALGFLFTFLFQIFSRGIETCSNWKKEIIKDCLSFYIRYVYSHTIYIKL